MNRFELRKTLDELGVSPLSYSLDGRSSIVGVVLYESYSRWLVFHIDERGNKSDEREFATEDEACSYILELFQDWKELF